MSDPETHNGPTLRLTHEDVTAILMVLRHTAKSCRLMAASASGIESDSGSNSAIGLERIAGEIELQIRASRAP